MSKLTQRVFSALAVSALALSANAQTFTTSVVASGIDNPVVLTSPVGDTNRMFVVEQHTGNILIIKNGSVLPTPFVTITGLAGGFEQGLLGLAFHPDYANNGEFFVNYTASGGGTRIAKHTVSGNPLTNDVANPVGDIVMSFSQPFSNHNGGGIVFGPDGYLYTGTGDGGSGGDPGNRAQNPALILGKMLRIDVDGDDFPGDSLRDYAIPAGQPNFGGTGLPELWMVGLRNPWRFGFDRLNGDMWIGDVGQNAREELNLDEGGVGGQNWGWKCKEGNNCFDNLNTFCTCSTPSLVDPVFTYANTGGASIIGGYAYRGPLTCIQGTYFFADLGGRIWTAEKDGLGGVSTVDRTNEFAIPGPEFIASFGEDSQGNVYILDLSGGEIHQISITGLCAPVPTEVCNGDGGDQMGCTNCPCGNNAVAGTSGGCLNSVNSVARLIGSGFPSVTGDSLRFELQGVPSSAFCILNSGNAVAPGGTANPCFGMDSGVQATQFDGLRCAIVNTQRHGGRSADGNGQVGFGNAGWGPPDGPPIGIIAQGAFVAGQTRAFQVINRDDPLLSCGRGLNTSQALVYSILP